MKFEQYLEEKKEAKKLDKAPKGWSKLSGATTAPKGYEWWSNGKSRFKDDYESALVKVAK